MTDLKLKLTSKFAPPEERIEGHLIYLKQYGLNRLNQKELEQKANLVRQGKQ